MPGTRCAVAVCNNSLLQTKRENLQVIYHKFPKNEQTCEAWVDACRRKDKWNPHTSTVCSAHFREDDYETDLKAKLLNIPAKRRLKWSAVPTLLLNSNNKKTLKATFITRKKLLAKKRRRSVKEIVESDVDPLVCEALLPENSNDGSVQIGEYTKEKYDKLLQEQEELKQKYTKLQGEFEEQKRQLENTEKLLTNLRTKFDTQTESKEPIMLLFVR